MARIETNFDEVPDQIMPVDPGVYTLTVEAATLEDVKPPKTGKKIVVILKVADEGNKNFGRQIYDHISTKMDVKIKRLCLSAGIKPGAGGFDTEDLIGKTLKARISNRTYKDDNGAIKESSSVQDYLIEGDAA